MVNIKKKHILFAVAIFTLTSAALFTYVTKTHISTVFSLISPLPHLFPSTYPKVLASSEFWKPSSTDPLLPQSELDLTASVVLSYDLATDQMIYAKNIHKQVPIASITKIMTAIVAIDNERLDKKMKISKKAAEVGENSMGLSENEVLSLHDLLYGLILPSGNDAAETIAENSTVGRENFVYLMNKKAQDLGLSNTNFTNPSGLEGDGDQHSTAYDLLVMSQYGLQNPIFADIVSTFEHEIPATNHNKEYHLYNDTNLLTTYPGVKGIKTGFTDEAGMCLVTYLEFKGHKIIGIVLNSTNRREEMKQLLDHSLTALQEEPPAHP